MNTEEIKRTAVHEAGHAICYALYGFKLWRVEIGPNGLSDIYYRVVHGKRIAGVCLPTRWGRTKIPASKWREYARIGCAGYAAESLCLGTADRETAEDDFNSVRHFLAKHGNGASFETIYAETVALLTRYRSAIWAIADELLASKRLSGARVKDIIKESR